MYFLIIYNNTFTRSVRVDFLCQIGCATAESDANIGQLYVNTRGEGGYCQILRSLYNCLVIQLGDGSGVICTRVEGEMVI